MATPRESRRYSDEQLRNARTIMYVGRQLGASNRDILVALMTGWQESGLRNLNWGDRDSVGVFQQRAGWGSLSQRMNVSESARMFFQGGHRAGTPGLLDNDKRNTMSLSQAAQWVQRSAYPDAYAKRESQARGILDELGAAIDIPEAPSQVPLVDTSLMPSTGESSMLADMGDQKMASLEAQPDKPLGLAAADAPGAEAADVMPALSAPEPAFDAAAFAPQDAGSGGGMEMPSFDDTGTEYTGKRGNYSLPRVQPWVVNAANEMGGKFGITNIGGYGHRGHETDHDDGLALDFMTKGATGNALAAYAQANAKRLGVKYIIWNQRIWSVGRANEGWRPMEDRGSATANHKDHVHVSFVGR